MSKLLEIIINFLLFYSLGYLTFVVIKFNKALDKYLKENNNDKN